MMRDSDVSPLSSFQADCFHSNSLSPLYFVQFSPLHATQKLSHGARSPLTFYFLCFLPLEPMHSTKFFKRVLVYPSVHFVLAVHRSLLPVLCRVLKFLHVLEWVVPLVHFPRTSKKRKCCMYEEHIVPASETSVHNREHNLLRILPEHLLPWYRFSWRSEKSSNVVSTTTQCKKPCLLTQKRKRVCSHHGLFYVFLGVDREGWSASRRHFADWYNSGCFLLHLEQTSSDHATASPRLAQCNQKV